LLRLRDLFGLLQDTWVVANAMARERFRQSIRFRLALVIQFLRTVVFVYMFFSLASYWAGETDLKVRYFAFLATGLAFQALFESWTNSASNELVDLQQQGLLEKYLTAPRATASLFLGAGLARAFEGMVRAFTILFISVWLAPISLQFKPAFLLALFCLFCFAQLLSLLGVSLNILFQRSYLVGFLSSLGLGLFSGVFVPIETLITNISGELAPSLVALLAQLLNINPIKILLDLFRFELGLTSESLSADQCLILLVWFSLLFLLAYILFKKALLRLRTQGSFETF
jgi:hypothetical protein